ncbi:MAG: trypsin-like peptidase domain-containing protein [bacterium]|nr:trypsin-like peptidase domain-containing protein [bacterium]
MNPLDRLLLLLVVILLAGGVLFFELHPNFLNDELVAYQNSATSSQIATVAKNARTVVSTSTLSASSTALVASTTPKKQPSTPKKTTEVAEESIPMITTPADPNKIKRIQNPYPFPPLSFETINTNVREALVNILCAPQSGALRPISGSGIIIDPRGVILTNAHVAQYVLLSQSPDINLSCMIRSGSPAVKKWRAVILYIPPAWVNEHAHEITTQHALGTGEHDYALLLITDSIDGRGTGYPFIPIDTRQAIGFDGDPVLAASYPAEFAGGLAAQNNLYAVSSVATIKKLLTFVQQTVDLVSLGGIIGAQNGSSGGAVVNQWNRLIGLIVTTSAGKTTDERDLRALTLSYIDRDMAAQTGRNLAATLGSDIADTAADFNEKVAPNLINRYIRALSPTTQ